MNPLQLYLLFAKIGFFTFGGGFAMIPFFQSELVDNYKLFTASEFADIVALAQMTPGPVGLNAATYLGQQQCGILGAAAATLGVCTPSLTIGMLVALCLKAFGNNRLLKAALRGIRPATLGLIAAAVIFFAETSAFATPLANLWTPGESFGLCWQGTLIFLGCLFFQWKWKPNMLVILLGAALAGAILCL